MCRKFLVTFIVAVWAIIFCNHIAFAQPHTLWAKTFGGEYNDEGQSVQQTSDGGFIIAGWTEPSGAGNKDVYLVKTDSRGDILWTNTYGGVNEDIARSVQQTDDGGYIIAGYTTSFGAGNRDVYLVKTDANGDLVWEKTYGGSGADEGYSAVQTEDGGYIVVGYEASFSGDIYGYGDADVWLIKTDAQGNFVWETIWSTWAGEWGRSVQQTADSGYVMIGSTFSAGSNESDIFLIKTNANGTILWTKFYGGGGVNHGGTVQLTSDGGYIIAGWTNFYGAGGIDVYLVKTDSQGNLQWQKTYGGTADDGSDGYSLVQEISDGGFIVTGWTRSFGSGGADLWLIKTDANGNSLWTKTYDGTGNDDFGWSVQETLDGGYIVTGSTQSEGMTYDLWLIRVTEALPDSSITIIWNRSTWETMVSDTILTEDFESEPETYVALITPYLTTGGILIEGVLSPIEFQIQPPSNVDTLPPHSQRLHVRDFGQMMSFTFPDSMRVAAFGFDFLHSASELWELHVNDTLITLQQVYAGFIGVLMKGGDVSSFILTSPEYAQGGITIDNISYIVPSELATTSKRKKKMIKKTR